MRKKNFKTVQKLIKRNIICVNTPEKVIGAWIGNTLCFFCPLFNMVLL